MSRVPLTNTCPLVTLGARLGEVEKDGTEVGWGASGSQRLMKRSTILMQALLIARALQVFAPAPTVHRLLNVGVYLQDHNTSAALDVLPNSHPPAAREWCLRAGDAPGGSNRTTWPGGVDYRKAAQYELFPRKGDAIIWPFHLSHRASQVTRPRRQHEPLETVTHRSLLTVGYGPRGEAGLGARRAFEFRDWM